MSRLNALAERSSGEDRPPHRSAGPPVRGALLERVGGGGPAKSPAAAPRCPSPDAPGGDPAA